MAEQTATLPNRPYQAVRYHYGMLLGVDDFETDQSYHRGKMRLHQGWLHGFGTVWGLGVSLALDAGEVRVAPGLALDGFGRELHVDVLQCLNLPAWYAEHQDDAELAPQVGEDGSITFTVHVVIRHLACLARPVPALIDTCAGGSSETAYSRVLETVELLLVPGPAPDWPRANHLWRLAQGLDAARVDDEGDPLPDDQAVLDALAALAGLPPEQAATAREELLRHAAIRDALAVVVGSDEDDVEAQLFTDGAPRDIVLAQLNDVVLNAAADTVTGGEVDNLVRPVLVATQSLQSGGTVAASTTSGPQVDTAGVTLAGTTLTLPLTRALLLDTVKPAVLSSTRFVAGSGWEDFAATLTAAADGLSLTVEFAADPAGNRVRVLLVGTGGKPILGDNFLPLYGGTGSTPGNDVDAAAGRDYVWTN
ncbi:MAG TPA: hypothetical protein VLC08_04295 [Chitinolyticbacter sp.]|nr:hypothetical protein [Chitinolyticbacter sp.]